VRNINSGCGRLLVMRVRAICRRDAAGHARLAVLLVAVTFVAACANHQDPPRSDPGSCSSKTTFTHDNFSDLAADPDSHQGDCVDIYGQVFRPPKVEGNEVQFQIYSDPKNHEGNTLVRADKSTKVNDQDYVHVTGKVRGSFTGKNAFGADVNAVDIAADKVEKADAAEALDPTQKTLQVGQMQGNQGFQVSIDKVEFGKETTRVYLTAQNNTPNGASLYDFNARIIQGSKQVNPDNSYEYRDLEPQTDIAPGVQTSGLIPFGLVDSSAPFTVQLEWNSKDFSLRPQPLVFDISADNTS
jgi:hypothetical protein